MTHPTRTIPALALTGALSLAAAVSAPVAAEARGGGDRVIARGTCPGAQWKIKAKPDDGRVEVEAEIDSSRSGQRWHWVLKHNGSRSASGSARTHGPSGSFSVERRTVDASGADTFVFRATRAGTACVARVTL